MQSNKTTAIALSGLMAVTALVALATPAQANEEDATTLDICPDDQEGNLIQVCLESHFSSLNVRVPDDVEPNNDEVCVIFDICVPIPAVTSWEALTIEVFPVVDTFWVIIDLCDLIQTHPCEFGTGDIDSATLFGATMSNGDVTGLVFTLDDGSNVLLPILE